MILPNWKFFASKEHKRISISVWWDESTERTMIVRQRPRPLVWTTGLSPLDFCDCNKIKVAK